MTTVEPVSAYPPASSRDLDGWLAEDLALLHPQDTPTRLRAIADTRAVRIAAWATGVSVGISAVIVGSLFFAITGRVSGLAALSGGGLLLAVVCALFLARARTRIPGTGRLRSVRGPGDLRSGLIAALLLYLATSAIMLVPALTTERYTLLIVANIAVLLLLVSVFVVPAAVLGRNREAFRHRARTDAALRARLEEDRLSWKPDHATLMYGPL